jgi:hypothetical protein
MSATAGDDSLPGTPDADTIDGLAGNDTITGLGGEDSLDGSDGNDLVLGGLDADTIAGGNDQDTLRGDAGNDTLRGESGNDSLEGEAGNDSLTGSFGNDTLDGGDGNDRMLGGSNDDVLAGGIGNDSLNGGAANDSAAGGSGADSLAGENGNDTLDGGDDADTLVGGGGSDSLLGGAGLDLVSYAANSAAQAVNLTAGGGTDGLGGTDSFASIERITGGAGADTMTFAGGGVTLAGASGDDLMVLGGGGSSVDGGGGTDTLGFTFDGTVTISGGSITGTGGFSANATGIELIRLNDGSTVAFGDGTYTVCFAAGTRILTMVGEVPVEKLQAGDLVATLSGRGAPMKPVLWVGRRDIALVGHPQAAALAPIRIRAGALGPATPHRDLLVSPDHCLFLDGALVAARLLVDGGSITVEEGLASVSYFHVELEAHDVLLAEGAAAESWLDCGNRAWFGNAAVALLAVAGALDAHATQAAEPCAPVIHGGAQLAAIRDAIALRAAEAGKPGPITTRSLTHSWLHASA